MAPAADTFKDRQPGNDSGSVSTGWDRIDGTNGEREDAVRGRE
jgi:hypothetical protein